MSFFSARRPQPIVSALAGALLTAFLVLATGCSRSTVSTTFQAPEFSLSEVRAAPALLVVSPQLQVKAFNKPYRALFKDSTALSARLSRKMLDSLAWAVPAPSPMRTRYTIYVRALTIGDSLEEIPSMVTPSIGGMQSTGGGTSKSCVVQMDVEILDSASAVRYAFTVRSKSEVAFYAYKTALLNALDGAARKAARHLSGH